MRSLALILLAACSSAQTAPPAPDAGLVPFVPADAARLDGAKTPMILAGGLAAPSGICVLGADVIAADSKSGTIVKVARSGGAPSTIATGLGEPWRLSCDGTDVFVSDRAGRVLRVALGGAVAELATNQSKPGRVRFFAGDVYWLDEGTMDGDGALRAVAAQGATIVELATGLSRPHDLAVTQSYVFYTEKGIAAGVSRLARGADAGAPAAIAKTYVPPMGIAADEGAAQIFFTTRDMAWPSAGNLYRAGLDGAMLTPLTAEPPNADAIVLGASDALWASPGMISRVSRAGGAYENVAIETSVVDFVIDGGFVYWTDAVHGSIDSAPL